MPESNLFRTVTINQMTLPNRIVRSATQEGLADDHGNPLGKLGEVYAELAEHGVGLIISGHLFVTGNGKAAPGQGGLDQDERIKGWKTVLNAAHAKGGRVAAQLSHAGCNACDHRTYAGPSPYAGAPDQAPCHELTTQEIAKLAMSYAEAACRARKAGFDAVQIHAAHGYLLSEFLSPVYNKRTDSYGGGCDNRARFLYEVIAAVRRELPKDYPVLVKINTEDFVPGGFSVEDCVKVCVKLQEQGVDAVELSGGLPISEGDRTPVRKSNLNADEPVYYENAARKVKAALTIPVILTGGIRFASTGERLIREQACDMISMSRPLIREPDLAEKWRQGSAAKAKCVSCNRCFRPILTGRGIYCPQDR